MTTECMLRVSWATNKHTDGQPNHTRRGEVTRDLGLEFHPGDDLTLDDMQAVAFAAKMAALKCLRARRPLCDMNYDEGARCARNKGHRGACSQVARGR